MRSIPKRLYHSARNYEINDKQLKAQITREFTGEGWKIQESVCVRGSAETFGKLPYFRVAGGYSAVILTLIILALAIIMVMTWTQRRKYNTFVIFQRIKLIKIIDEFYNE